MLRGLRSLRRLTHLVAPALVLSGSLVTLQNPPATCAPTAEVLSELFIYGDEMHSALMGGPEPNHEEMLVMASDFLGAQAKPPKVVPANPAAVVDLQKICKMLWEVEQVTVSLDCPGYSYIFPTLDSLIMDSWVRNNLHVVYAAADMCLHSVEDLQPDQRLRLGFMCGKECTLATSVAVSAWLATIIARGHNGTEFSHITDGSPAHNQPVDFGAGSHAIDARCLFAVYHLKEALEKRRAVLILGDGNMQACRP